MNAIDELQIAIARRTLEMNDFGVSIMGGMTMDEARAVLKKHCFSVREEQYAR
ncbi:MAG: hypothetical protein WBL92_01235 [Methanothrix sp.]